MVFTEIFLGHGLVRPCAANPLSTEELRKAGVFWVGGDKGGQLSAVADRAGGQKPTQGPSPSSPPRILPGARSRRGGAQPVMLTRLHVRYTAKRTFPEDLSVHADQGQTKLQTRYVIQNPYAGSVAACTDDHCEIDCDGDVQSRVGDVERMVSVGEKNNWGRSATTPTNHPTRCKPVPQGLQRQQAQRHQNPTRYYARTARTPRPRKQTLAKLTGWSMAEIDHGRRQRQRDTGSGKGRRRCAAGSAHADTRTWWQSCSARRRTSYLLQG